VSAYSSGRERSLAGEGTERLAQLAHEMRNLLYTGMLAFAAIEKGSVGRQRQYRVACCAAPWKT
jgi:hypothetical protein